MKGMAAQTKAWNSIVKLWHSIVLFWQKQGVLRQQSSESADYLAWQNRFLANRLRLCLWVAVPCFITIVMVTSYELFIDPQRFNAEILKHFGNPNLADRVRHLVVISNVVIGSLLASCLLLRQTQWGQRHPAVLFLGFSWSMTLVPQIIGTHFRLPEAGGGGIWFLVFLAQATLIPVRWRLHLFSQLGAFVYYVGVNPLLGLTTIEGKSIYNSGMFIYLFWFCFICDLAVYLYERLQRAEFESRRELRVFLHSISHDLKTPVMGTSIVLQNLLKKTTDDRVTVDKTVLERLLQGSDRQLSLINALLEAHEAEVHELVLHRQSVQLSELVNAVLTDLKPTLIKNQITVDNQIGDRLPALNADPTQLWRVYSNLITNAIKHNPHGITVILGAEVKGNWLHCFVQDNGLGIPSHQRERLFELYARGSRARYMPGLGLGLYLCRQIVAAHGGEIYVTSAPQLGTTFWFTLPLIRD